MEVGTIAAWTRPIERLVCVPTIHLEPWRPETFCIDGHLINPYSVSHILPSSGFLLLCQSSHPLTMHYSALILPSLLLAGFLSHLTTSGFENRKTGSLEHFPWQFLYSADLGQEAFHTCLSMFHFLWTSFWQSDSSHLLILYHSDPPVTFLTSHNKCFLMYGR